MSVNILLNDRSYISGTNKMVYNFPTSIKLTNKEVCLSTLSYYNCFYNISAANGNNVMTFSFPTSYANNNAPVFSNFTYTFTDGFYSITDINLALQSYFTNAKLYMYDNTNKKNIYFILLMSNNPLYAYQINTYYIPSTVQATSLNWTLPSGSPLVLNTLTGATCKIYSPMITLSLGLGYLLGFSAGQYPPANVTKTTTGAGTDYSLSPCYYITGPFAPQINYVRAILIRCNLINNFGYANPTDLLQLVPITSSFGAISQYENSNSSTYSTILNNNQFSYIELSFYNQNLNPLIFRDGALSATLSIRDANTNNR